MSGLVAALAAFGAVALPALARRQLAGARLRATPSAGQHVRSAPKPVRGTSTAAGDEAALALALELLAAGLAAGAPVATALEAAAVGGGEVACALQRAAAAVRLGTDPAQALAGMEGLRRAGSVLGRSAAHGVAAAPALRALARDLRRERALAAAERARRAGVRVVAPLTACFLPAFVLVSVVPMVLGLAPAR